MAARLATMGNRGGDGFEGPGAQRSPKVPPGGSDVRLWTRRAEVAEEINSTSHTNTGYLDGCSYVECSRATTDSAEAWMG